jgi:hypothetical protein
MPWQYPTAGLRLCRAAVNMAPHTPGQTKKEGGDAPAIRDEHPAQLLHPNAVPAKEHVKRHGPPNVLIDLPDDTTAIAVYLRQQLREHARLLHLESAARLEPHLGPVRKRHTATDEPAELPALLAPRGPPELRDPNQPVAMRQLVLGDWPVEAQQRCCTARSRWRFGHAPADTTTAAATATVAARGHWRRQRLRPGTPPRAYKGVPVLALCSLPLVMDHRELAEQTP